MATWDTVMTPLVRSIIQDVDSDYSDARIKDVLIASAHLVLSDIVFLTTYTVDVINETITPDPVSLNDISFLNLVSLRASLFILSSELKTAASQGVMIKDGPSIVDTRQFFVSQKNRYEMMLNEYNAAKIRIQMGDLSGGLAVLGPFTNENASMYIWS